MRHIARAGMLVAGAGFALLTACSTDLNITNPNAPDRERAFSTPDAIASLIGTSFRHWYIANQAPNPGLAHAVMADALTASFGNFGMRFNASEPRLAYDNASSSSDIEVARDPWNDNYRALSEANAGLGAIDNLGSLVLDGDDVTDQYKALGLFVQGVTLGNVALIFDKGFVVDETTELPAPADYVPYGEIAKVAVAKLDAAIALSKNASWELPGGIAPGVTLSGKRMAQFANTMAARILAYTPRTAAENAQVDWAKVAQYAREGISAQGDTWSVVITGDGGNNWYDEYKGYANLSSWLRVDMRLINMMDPSQPAKYPSDCSALPAATSADRRLTTDFQYHATVPFQQARGCYFFSHYSHSRYVDVSWGGAEPFKGPTPFVLVAENDLLLAEAIVRSGGNLGDAAALVNRTREGRGNLPPVAAVADDLLKAIQYEQDIELLNASTSTQYFNRRRIDGLQAGTPRHLPVPATELELTSERPYTFGGSSLPDM